MRRFIATASILIILYLVLVHFTGFTKDVSQLGTSSVGLVKAFQGR